MGVAHSGFVLTPKHAISCNSMHRGRRPETDGSGQELSHPMPFIHLNSSIAHFSQRENQTINACITQIDLPFIHPCMQGPTGPNVIQNALQELILQASPTFSNHQHCGILWSLAHPAFALVADTCQYSIRLDDISSTPPCSNRLQQNPCIPPHPIKYSSTPQPQITGA